MFAPEKLKKRTFSYISTIHRNQKIQQKIDTLLSSNAGSIFKSLLLGSESNLGSSIAFHCHVSFVSFSLEQVLNVCLFFFSCLFILRERERERERARERASRGGAEQEGERESQAVSTPSVQSPMQGSNPWTTRSWPKSRVRHLNYWATQAPQVLAI